MSPREHLFSLYEQWRRLSLAEGDAIQQGDWLEVRRCQNAKQTLQERIVAATDALRTDPLGRAADAGETESAIRTVVSRLMELESLNSRRLADQRARGEAEQSGAERATQSLRQVSRAYGLPRASGWQNYS